VISFHPRSRLLPISFFLACALASSICSTQELTGRFAKDDEARNAMSHGDYAKAERLYREAIERDATSATLLTDLGVTLQIQGRATEAIQVFERALKEKYLPETYALLAEQRCISRDFEGARPMLTKIMRDHAGDSNVVAIVAPCFLDLDEPLESVKAYTILLRDGVYPKDLALIQLSKSYLAAAQYFVTELRQRTDGRAYVTALDQAGTSGNPRSAFPMAESVSPNFHSDLGFDVVLAIWHKHEDDSTLLYQLAVLSGEQSMHQIELCDRSYPDSPYLAQLQFEMLADQGREDEAVSGFEGLIHSHPEMSDLRYDLGMLFRRQHQWDKSLAVFQDELSANPKDERAAARVSEALGQLMRWTELQNFLTPRVQQNKTPLWAMLDLAEALEQLEEKHSAISLLSKAELEYPSSRAVHFRLLHLYRTTGDMPKAVVEAKWFKDQPS
jgi:tetratricopeptide (TPR) repeat protein